MCRAQCVGRVERLRKPPCGVPGIRVADGFRFAQPILRAITHYFTNTLPVIFSRLPWNIFVSYVLREIEPVQYPQGFSDISSTFFRVEWAIGSEHYLFGRIERQPACRRGIGSEHRGIGVKILLEIVERAFFQAFAQAHIIFVRGTGAELVPARPDPAFEDRHDAAEMMDDDFQVRMAVDAF